MLWSDDLTDQQLKMLIDTERGKYGVEVRGARWNTARTLVAKGLARIEGDAGTELPALMWATEDGKRILTEFDDIDDCEPDCIVCGRAL